MSSGRLGEASRRRRPGSPLAASSVGRAASHPHESETQLDGLRISNDYSLTTAFLIAKGLDRRGSESSIADLDAFYRPGIPGVLATSVAAVDLLANQPKIAERVARLGEGPNIARVTAEAAQSQRRMGSR